MKKESNITIIFRCFVTVVLLLYILGSLFSIFERKDSRDSFQEFYELQENIDVLFFGTSHVYNGISPMDIWEQNGIVSYNLGSPGCRIASAYWMMQNALQYTTPKLIVFDSAYLLDAKTHSNINFMHRIFDSMPLTRVKVEAIMDLYDKKEDISRFLFPFSLYHNRWDELSKEDFFYKPVYGKMGFMESCDVIDAVLPDFTPSEEKAVDNISTQYLNKIIDLCKQRNIKLLLTFLPYNVNEDSKNDAVFLQALAKEHGINYLGPEELLEIVNPNTDFMNNDENNSHFNLSGAHKMSYYLGNYISETYGIPDQRQNPTYKDWHQYYAFYEDYKVSLLHDQGRLENYLVAMADKNYTSFVYIHDQNSLQDNLVSNLLNNLNPEIREAQGGESVLLATKGGNTLANVQISENAYPILYLNDDIQHHWEIPVTSADIFIIVMNEDGTNVLDTAAFSLASKERLS